MVILEGRNIGVIDQKLGEDSGRLGSKAEVAADLRDPLVFKQRLRVIASSSAFSWNTTTNETITENGRNIEQKCRNTRFGSRI